MACVLKLIPLFLLVACASQAQEPSLTQLTDQQLASRIPRYGQSPWMEEPVSDTSKLDPALAELAKRVEAGDALDVECWRTILIDRGYLRWRTRWPKDVPFAVSFHLPALGADLAVTLTTTEPGWKAATATYRDFESCANCLEGRLAREDYQELGALRSDQERVAFQISVELPQERSSEEASKRRAVRVGTFEIVARPVAGIDDVLEPSGDETLGRTLTEGLYIHASETGDDRDGAWLEADAELPPALACSLEVAFVRDGRPGRSSHLVFERDYVAPVQIWGCCNLPELERRLVLGQEAATGLSLRLRGTSTDVLRNWDATHYWSGEVEIPVAELIKRRTRLDAR
jgi:hypothetical protein